MLSAVTSHVKPLWMWIPAVALASTPPFRVVAASAEFCLAAPQDSADCESVQFVSGLGLDTARPTATVAAGGGDREQRILLTYGVNDCEARLATLPAKTVWSMLEARPPAPRRSHGWDG